MKKTIQLWASAAPLAVGFALIATPAFAQDADVAADENAAEIMVASVKVV